MDINEAHTTALARRLRQFIVNAQEVMTTAQGCLVQTVEALHDVSRVLTAEWLTEEAHTVDALSEEVAQIHFGCRTLQETAALAEQDLLELLALVGVDLGAQVRP